MPAFTVNGQAVQVDAEPDTPLLWVLRDHLNLTGTKFGCGVSACGTCTVHLDGNALRSCVIPVSACEGKHHYHRGALGRTAACIRAAGVDRASGPAVRVLPGWDDHGRGGAPQRQPQPNRRGHRRGDHQHLPLRHLPAREAGDPGAGCRNASQALASHAERTPYSRQATQQVAPSLPHHRRRASAEAWRSGCGASFESTTASLRREACKRATARPFSPPGSRSRPTAA